MTAGRRTLRDSLGITWELDSESLSQRISTTSSDGLFWEVGKWQQIFNIRIRLRTLGCGVEGDASIDNLLKLNTLICERIVSHRVGEKSLQTIYLIKNLHPKFTKSSYKFNRKKITLKRNGQKIWANPIKEDIQIANKHMKRISTSSVVKELKLNNEIPLHNY